MEYTKQVKKWDVFEYVCHGSEDGNPFVDYWIKGHFVHAKEAVETDPVLFNRNNLLCLGTSDG